MLGDHKLVRLRGDAGEHAASSAAQWRVENSVSEQFEWRAGINHRSAKGYAACGATVRPVDAEAQFLGDVVCGELSPSIVNCEACLALDMKP